MSIQQSGEDNEFSWRTLDNLLCSENKDTVLADEEGIYFSPQSNADVFEVFDDIGGNVQRDLNDDTIRKYLDVCSILNLSNC